MPKQASNKRPDYGVVRSTRQLGQLMRSHRKSKGWTLEKLSGFARVSMRFLSEFERGKETAEIGKAMHALQFLGLEVIVLPRHKIPVPLRSGAKTHRERGQ